MSAVCQPYIRRLSAIPNLPICRPKYTVQEYVSAVKEQQVLTDFHLDRLSVQDKTPSKRRRTCLTQLYDFPTSGIGTESENQPTGRKIKTKIQNIS